MIEIKTYSKPKKTGGSGVSSSPTKYISGVISEAEHAGRADKAKRAEVADQANYAGTAASAQNAAYASEAGNLHADAEILQKYLSLEDTVDPQVVKGMVIFAKGLIAKALVDLEMGAKFGNNAMVTKLGEAVFSVIKSIDYDNAAEQGFSVEKEKNGKYHAFFTNLTIWGKAMFHELEVRKLSYSGGNIYLSGAGSKIIKVVPVKKSVSADGVTSWVETTEEDVERFGWKCYLLADNGTTATMNYWQEGDQARCQTMGEIAAGGAYSDVSNKSYWRTIPNGGVSTQNEKIYGKKTETYLDEDGNEQTREVQVELYDGQAFAWIVIGKHCGAIDGYDDEFSVDDNGSNPAPLETRDIPSAGDTIVLDGNRHRNKQGEYDKTDRQNVIILETTGEYAPRISCYANITEYKHTFTKRVNGSDKEVSLSVFETSPKGGTKINSSRFEWISDDGSTINIINYRGDWVSNNTYYHKNDQVNHNNAVWVCIANSGVDVTEEPSDGATYWKKVLSGGKGEKGDDGKTPQPTGSAELYYAITSSPSTEPDDYSWTITPIDTSKYQGKFLWTDNRTEWKIGDKTEWISNKTCSYIGKDGANGTSVSIKGSLSDIGELPVSGNVNGDSYLIDGYLWIYTDTSVDDNNHHNGFENVGKIKGEDGISATQYYYHVAWMNTSDNSDNSFTTTNPSGSSYAYIGTLIDTTENDSDDYTKYDWAYVKGDRGEDGKNAVRLDLTNESSTVTCDKDGNIIGTIQGTVAILYDGAKEADINMVSYFISSYKGLSSMPTISEGGVISGLSVSGGKTSLEASINIKAVYKNQDYYATYTITKVLAGSDGTPATSYWIEPSATAIKVDSDGNANPSTITCRQYKQVGAESPVDGDKKIYYRHNAIDSRLWNEYTEAIIPAVNVEAYEFVLADMTPSNSHAIIYDRESIPVVKDGQNGNDAMLFRLYLSKSSVNYATDSGINNIYVYVMQTIGGKNSRTLIANMQKLCKAKFYVEYVNKDGSVIKEYRDGTTGIINSNSRFDTLAYAQLAPTKFYIDLVSADDDSIVIDTKEVIVVKDGEQGESALEIIVTPETLAFDTNDYGLVPTETSKQASISCYRNGVKVTNVSYLKSTEENCLASISESNGSATVTISKITSQEVADSSGNSSTISNTSGYATIQVWDKDTNLYHRVQVKFMVNVAKFTGQMVNTNKQFSKTLTEVGNSVNDKIDKSDLTEFKSEITQTAREISLSVSEKSIGRRNLLVGSAFRRQGEVSYIVDSHPYFIRMNDGYGGTNCAYMSKSGMTQNVWCGAMWNPVTVKPNTKYTFSMMLKVMSVCDERFDVQFIDVTYNSSNSVAFDTLAAADKMETFGWTLKKITITTPSLCTKLRIDAFIRRNGTAYMCRPMLEEGENYNGWTLSEQDYDYIGGNMLDNTLSLDKSGSLYDVNGTLTPAGFGESTSIYKSFVYKLKGTVDSFSQLPSSGNVYNDTYFVRNEVTCYKYNGSEFENVGNDYYYEVLSWRKSDEDPFGLEANKDYVFSFMAKGTGRLTAYFYYPDTDVFIEDSLGGSNIVVNGQATFQLTNKWERYWVHWRPSDSLHRYIILRLSRTIQSIAGDAPITNCYIAQPKLEEGAVVTEYTERKSDLVDKASLKAAGIEITSNQVTLYGNKVQVKNPKENPSEGYDEAAMFQNGKLNAQFINAGEVVAKGIKTQELEAQNLNVTGNSRLGIFEIHKAEIDEREKYTVNGDSIKYSGSYKFPDGKTEASGAGSFLTYKPMFVRQGAPDDYEYMRLGHQFTEWDDGNISGGSKNYFFVGAAARYVCSGDEYSCTRNVLPVKLKYNPDIKPAAYIYSVLAKDSAAFAIYTKAVGTAGERLAIQTNGAIRGVEALNVETIYISKQISSGIGAARCINTAEITIRLPINPVVGQKFYVLQEDTGKVNITGDSNHQIILFNKGIVTTCNSNTKGQISVFIWSGNYWFGSFLTGTL